MSVLNMFKLSFETEIEQKYLKQSFDHAVPTVRFGILLGALLYSVFAILDQYVLPETADITFIIRFGFVLPLLAAVFIATFLRNFRKFFVPAIMFTSLLLGYGIIMILYFSKNTESGSINYYNGLLLVIIWIGSLSQLRFKHVVCVIVTVILGYLFISIVKQNMLIGGFDNPKFPVLLNNFFFIVSAAILAFYSSYSFEKFKRETFLQKMTISHERIKSDKLLLNILPEQVARELKETGKAKPKKHNNVTILFTDFIGFTSVVASIPAEDLVNELNEIFSGFDDIMEEYHLEKIETIGDAYMAACGLPAEDADHALKSVNAAHQMLSYLEQRNSTSTIQWNMRVGLHSGAIVAGVVGKRKYAYDLFGDSVNIASRMESNGASGRVNVSRDTYELIKDSPNFTFKSRGRILVKGKGEMSMWFVDQVQSKSS